MGMFSSKINVKGKGSQSFIRWWVVALIALALSVGTWNPMGYDFIHRIITLDYTELFSYLEAFIVFLLWSLSFVALYSSIGKWGIFSIVFGLGLLIGGLVQNGILNLSNMESMGWVVNIAIAFLIWFGVMAPRFWRILTGQYVTTEAGDI